MAIFLAVLLYPFVDTLFFIAVSVSTKSRRITKLGSAARFFLLISSVRFALDFIANTQQTRSQAITNALNSEWAQTSACVFLVHII